MSQSYFIFLAATVLMIFLLFHASKKFINLLASNHSDAYEKLGRPDILKNFKFFIKYIKSKDYQDLKDEELDSLGQVINFLYLAGISLIGLTAIVLLTLYAK